MEKSIQLRRAEEAKPNSAGNGIQHLARRWSMTVYSAEFGFASSSLHWVQLNARSEPMSYVTDTPAGPAQAVIPVSPVYQLKR